MKILKYIALSLTLLLVFATADTRQISAQTCSRNVICSGIGTPEMTTNDSCIVSGNYCQCENTKARTCRIQQGTCRNSGAIWEKWDCDLMKCPCTVAGLDDGDF